MRHVHEVVLAGVVIEDAGFGTFRMQVSGEGVLERHVVLGVPLATNGIGRVPSDVDQEQIELAVVVVVEEHRGRRVSRVVEAGRHGNVFEVPLAVVLEEHVAAADRGHVEVLVAVVVDIGEGGRDVDLARNRHAGRGCDVLEAPAAEIPPQLVAAHLADEVDVGAAVAVDVSNRHPRPVIVVRRLVGLAGVVHDAGLEIDAAFGQPIGELEVVEGGEPGRRFDLGGRLLLEPLGGLEIGRDVTDRNFLSGYAEAEDEHSHSHHNPSSHVVISVEVAFDRRRGALND